MIRRTCGQQCLSLVLSKTKQDTNAKTHSVKKGQVRETKQHLQCGTPNKETKQNKMILLLALV